MTSGPPWGYPSYPPFLKTSVLSRTPSPDCHCKLTTWFSVRWFNLLLSRMACLTPGHVPVRVCLTMSHVPRRCFVPRGVYLTLGHVPGRVCLTISHVLGRCFVPQGVCLTLGHVPGRVCLTQVTSLTGGSGSTRRWTRGRAMPKRKSRASRPVSVVHFHHRGTLPIRTPSPVGPYSGPMPRDPW